MAPVRLTKKELRYLRQRYLSSYFCVLKIFECFAAEDERRFARVGFKAANKGAGGGKAAFVGDLRNAFGGREQ